MAPEIKIEDMNPQSAIMRISSQITKIETFLEKYSNNTINSDQLLDKIEELSKNLDLLHQKVESQDSLYYGLLKSILAEFNDHRQAFYLLLEANGIPCDDIKGWNVNNYEESLTNDNRESKRNVRKAKRKRRRDAKNVKHR